MGGAHPQKTRNCNSMSLYSLVLDLNQIVDGKTLSEHLQFYTVNVKYLHSVTHEQFCSEFPNAAAQIARANEQMDKLTATLALQGEK